jgi:hypothetical protein
MDLSVNVGILSKKTVVTMLLVICILFGIFSVSSNSLGVKAYNINEEYRKRNMAGFGFVTFNLVMSVLFLAGSIGLLTYVNVKQ